MSSASTPESDMYTDHSYNSPASLKATRRDTGRRERRPSDRKKGRGGRGLQVGAYSGYRTDQQRSQCFTRQIMKNRDTDFMVQTKDGN